MGDLRRLSPTLIVMILAIVFLLGSLGVATSAAGSSDDQVENNRLGLAGSNQNTDVFKIVNQQRSMMYSEQQFQPNPDPSAPRPRPSGSINFDSGNITVEESFNVTVNVTNVRGLASQPAGAPSLISVSFPYLDRPEDSARVEIIDHNFPKNSIKTVVVTRNGEDMMHSDGETRSIEYAVAEVSMIEGKWEEGESRFITVKVTPRNPGEFKVNARARLWNHESVQPPKRQNFWPDKDAGHRDQQLYSVRYEYVEVASPTPTPTTAEPPLNNTGPFSDLDLAKQVASIIGDLSPLLIALGGVLTAVIGIISRRYWKDRHTTDDE